MELVSVANILYYACADNSSCCIFETFINPYNSSVQMFKKWAKKYHSVTTYIDGFVHDIDMSYKEVQLNLIIPFNSYNSGVLFMRHRQTLQPKM